MPWLFGILCYLLLEPSNAAVNGLLGDMFSKILVGRLTGGGADCSEVSDTQGIMTNLMLQKTGNCKRAGKASRKNAQNEDSPTSSPPTPQRKDSTVYTSQSTDARFSSKSAVDWSQYYARNNGLTGPNIPSSSSPLANTLGREGSSGSGATASKIQTKSMRPDIAGSQARMQAVIDDSSGSYTQDTYKAKSSSPAFTSSTTKSGVRGTFNPRTREEDP